MLRFLICVTILPIIMGLGFIRLKKEKGTESLTECYILGLLFLFLLGEAVSCIVIKLEESFSFYTAALLGSIGCAVALSLVIGRKMPGIFRKRLTEYISKIQKEISKKDNIKKDNTKKDRVFFSRFFQVLIFALLIGLPILGLMLYVPDTGNSTMAETILVTTSSDTVFAYNPVTGKSLEYGMYPIYKFASLPLLYSVLYQLCRMPFDTFLFYAIPVWVLFLFAALMAFLGERLFKERKEKKQIFLLFLGVLIVSGDGETSTLAYGLCHSAFRGEVLASAVIIPFAMYMLQCFFEKKDRLYGAVGILLSLCGILVARPLFLPEGIAFAKGDCGREWMLLALSVFALYLTREKTKKKWSRQEIFYLGSCLLLGILNGSVFPMLGTAYVCACLYGVAGERKKAVPLAVGIILMLFLAGTILPLRGACIKKEDVPKSDVEIQGRIVELAQRYEKEVVLVAPENVMEQAKLHNSKVVLPYGKDLWKENCNREIADVYTDKELLLFEQMKTDYMQPDTVAAMAAEIRCNILVMREGMSEEMLIRGGWTEAEEVTGYAVYYR